MEFEEYCRHAFMRKLPAPLIRMNMALMSDGKLACKRFQIGISHHELQHPHADRQHIVDRAIQELHNALKEAKVQSINEQSLKATNKIPARMYTITIDAYIINDELSEGGIFYQIGETYAQLVN